MTPTRRAFDAQVVTYSSAIAACDRAGEWTRALSLLGEMRAVLPELSLAELSLSLRL